MELTQRILSWAVCEGGLIEKESLIKKLSSNKRLRVKLGIDPTASHIHLGHGVVLDKLAQFQERGDEVYLVIGDFTARIGDPTERASSRKQLSTDEIKKNIATYKEQASRYLNLNSCHFVYNSEWLSKLTLADFIDIAAKVGISNLIEREDFSQRLKSNQPLFLHETFYPIFQAYDSVEIQSDVEIGGWDQRLNMLMGRTLQAKYDQPPQDIVLVKPLIGLDGQRKMSSSFNNYIGITDTAEQMYGKIMSIKDDLIANYGELAAHFDKAQIEKLTKIHPKQAKQIVAKTVVERFYGLEAAEEAEKHFEDVFFKKNKQAARKKKIQVKRFPILLYQAVSQALSVSHSQANRLIEQSAVKVNGTLVKNKKMVLDGTREVFLEVGKYGFFSLEKKS